MQNKELFTMNSKLIVGHHSVLYFIYLFTLLKYVLTTMEIN